MKLSKEAFERARDYMKNNAEKIELALFEYHFEGGSYEEVIKALREYENEDGGFGKGLEYDFTLSASSPMATTIAFQYLRKINASSDIDMIKEGIKYFIDTFDKDKNMWHALSKEANNYPHAPWWHYDESTGGCAVEHCFANPSAEIIGYLNEYKDLVPKDFLTMVTDMAIEKLLERPDKLEMHEMLCYLRMSEKLPVEKKEAVIDKLRKSVRNSVELNSANWEGYGAKPSIIVDSTESPLIDLIKEEVELSLDYEIGKQTSEGFWEPNWSWGQYEESWELAKEKWRGRLTVETLIKLKRFGRIEEKGI